MSFGTSPISPSLLAHTPVDAHPRGGGILLNGSGHRTSLSDPAGALDPASAAAAASGSHPSLPLRIATPPVPGKPLGGAEALHAPLSGSLGADGAGGRGSLTGVSGGDAPGSVLMGRSGSQSQSRDGDDTSPKPAHKIRFAPLPDPRRPRSLSTGRNIALGESVLDENGEETRGLVLRGMGENDEAVDDEYDEEDDGEDGGEGGEGAGKRGRSWSKTMGSSWKGTKKLLSGKNPVKEKEKEGAYDQGAPLQKSVSTGGFIGASPFRWTVETERRRSMQGPPPASVTSLLSARRPDGPSPTSSYTSTPTPASPGLSPSTAAATHHRRNSSYEHTQASSLGASPTPVRMLNGRVYGSRRASEAAERERKLREKNEPAFVEWGATGLGGGAGPTSAPPAAGRVPGKTSFLGDEDDGGGMAWVKRRREERLRKEQEEKEKAARGDAAGDGGEAEADPGSSPTTTLSSAGDSSPRSGTHPNAGLSSSQSSQSSLESPGARTNLGISTNPQTPAINVDELPPTPTIRVSSDSGVDTLDGQSHPHATSPVTQSVPSPSGISVALASGAAGGAGKADPGLGLGKQLRSPEMDGSPKTVATRDEGATEKQAMRIPSGGERSGPGGGAGGDPFGEEEPRGRGEEGESDSEEEDGEEDEEEEDDGDFDDDEEEELDAVRTTSSAAGVEVISRHKN
ncbi:hypothetical protein IAT38_007524 [Cryptococcus sp. DSM 104549]